MVNNLSGGFFGGDDTFGGWIADQRQNEAIHELDARLASTRSRLNSEMRRISGSLEQRLDRLSTSFDAFVELSDVRALLAMFPEAAVARYRTHRVLAGEADDDGDRDDVAGYWLCPAARGLAAAVRGDSAAARLRIGEAAALDPLRSGTFALLAAAVAAPREAPALADWILPRILPELPEEVTRYQRALWLLAADGRLGGAAREHVRGLAAEAVRRAGEGGGPAARPEFWATVAPATTPAPGTRVLDGRDSAAHARVVAADRLAALRGWLEEALAAEGAGAGAAGVEAGTGETGGGADTGGTGDGRPGAAPAAPEVAETLRMLVDEGTAEEAPLLRRAAQLRAVVESSGSASPDDPVAAWTDTVGSAADLLRADAAAASAPAPRRALAVWVHAPEVLRAAQDLAGRAGAPVPDEAQVSHHGRRVRVTSTGPDTASLAAAEAQLAATYATDRGNVVGAAAAGGVAVLAAVAALAAGAVLLWWVAAAGLAAAGVFGYRHRAQAGAAAASVEAARRQLRAKADTGVQEWRAQLAAAEAAEERARADLAAVRRLLAA
ncbi:hypothetical protein ACFONH_01825 [Streptomonospora nanhaiensis]|uniref:hypothetical protein n=1 Tax=Streptomonospora nanhaiensis TaxID=1323731 RepID=UPI001C38C498|nr:hypothetical protein [Streptomonospora nanhaiensis]MBV2362117.1 hypothetical protein [Streptomonospora nanhaiensis]MBV2364811.1 hypothetical protein [Streptomonospora nanhaiensis]MBX9388570.1 hypothetical protein [Streptomonospora nanhaiensis]